MQTEVMGEWEGYQEEFCFFVKKQQNGFASKLGRSFLCNLDLLGSEEGHAETQRMGAAFTEAEDQCGAVARASRVLQGVKLFCCLAEVGDFFPTIVQFDKGTNLNLP